MLEGSRNLRPYRVSGSRQAEGGEDVNVDVCNLIRHVEKGIDIKSDQLVLRSKYSIDLVRGKPCRLGQGQERRRAKPAASPLKIPVSKVNP